MDGYLGEIRLFAGTFPPRGWAFCNGQLISINTNQALFAIIGCYYGGDCRVSMGLPNLGGRAAVGAGQGPGLLPWNIGTMHGIEAVTLHTNEMPLHTHQAVYNPPGFTATLEPQALNGKGSQTGDPTGAYMADAPADAAVYSSSSNVEMGESPVNFETQAGALAINPAGNSVPHNNMQPSLALHYIICIDGLFPSRN